MAAAAALRCAPDEDETDRHQTIAELSERGVVGEPVDDEGGRGNSRSRGRWEDC
jgi:hypothetical protein